MLACRSSIWLFAFVSVGCADTDECSSWVVEAADTSGEGSGVHVLVGDAGPSLWMTAGAALRQALRVAPGSWQIEDQALDRAPSSGAGFALAPDGRLWAAYETGGTFAAPGEIVLGTLDAGAWSFEGLGVEGRPVWVGFDGTGEAHLFASGHRIDRAEDGWQGALGGAPTDSVVFGADATAHTLVVRYTESQQDADSFRTHYIEYVAIGPDGSVQDAIPLREPVWEADVVGGAVAIDPTGGVQICWFSGAAGDDPRLMRTRIDAQRGTVTEVVAEVRSTGCAIAVDAGGSAHIGFTAEEDLSSTVPELRYATDASGAWTEQTIRADARVTSIALAGGGVHLAWTEARRFNEPAGDVGWARGCVP